jgi:ribosomal protein S12 methylthiotransferase
MDKLCRYLDMPIQHASDEILASMRRGLGQNGIRDRIKSVRKVIPDIRLRSTVIVGYPNESDNDFKQICDFVEEIQFDRLGIFTYSEEEGTIAEKLEDNVPLDVKNERKIHLQELQNSIMLEKNESMINSTIDVIIDENDNDVHIGRSEFDSPEVDNIVIVHGRTEIGNIEKVKITDASMFELEGNVCN